MVNVVYGGGEGGGWGGGISSESSFGFNGVLDIVILLNPDSKAQ